MIVSIATQKGGAGKSTVSIVLATYLYFKTEYEVAILDMDAQASAFRRRAMDLKDIESLSPSSTEYKMNRSLISRRKAHYPIERSDVNTFKAKLTEFKNKHVVFLDLPGSIQSPEFREGIKYLDHLFVPLDIDKFSVNSAVDFIKDLVSNILTENKNIQGVHLFWNKYNPGRNKEFYTYVEEEFKRIFPQLHFMDAKFHERNTFRTRGSSTLIPDPELFDKLALNKDKWENETVPGFLGEFATEFISSITKKK
jgi:cellulose biosynthesis protein BcsQ